MTGASLIGYAVKQRGNIELRTVGPTARSAMVNWLCVGARILPTSEWTDGMIEEAFGDLAERRHAALVQVRIEEVPA